MWMYLSYSKINDKTHFWYVFGHFFREFEKKLKFKHWSLFSMYYDKQYIVDGFWMMGVPLMDPK